MNAGLRALKKASPEAFNKITGGMSNEEKADMAAMGMKILKDYGMGGKMYEEGGSMYGYGGKNMYAKDGKKMPKELLDYFKSKEAEYGMKVMRNGGETPGLDVKSRKTQVGFDVERQEPIMDEALQIYIDGLPVSAKEALAFMKEGAEGMEGQVSSSLGDAMEAAIARRMSEMQGGRGYMGPGIYRPTAEQELDMAQRAAGVDALMERLASYSSRRKRDF
jgi:hypothetical protein